MTIENALKSRQIGSTGLTVFPLALGCMGMSGIYGSTNDDESIATIHAAITSGSLRPQDFVGVFLSLSFAIGLLFQGELQIRIGAFFIPYHPRLPCSPGIVRHIGEGLTQDSLFSKVVE
jgi:hypothetical protein